VDDAVTAEVSLVVGFALTVRLDVAEVVWVGDLVEPGECDGFVPAGVMVMVPDVDGAATLCVGEAEPAARLAVAVPLTPAAVPVAETIALVAVADTVAADVMACEGDTD
jgi:hypothetical protein